MTCSILLLVVMVGAGCSAKDNSVPNSVADDSVTEPKPVQEPLPTQEPDGSESDTNRSDVLPPVELNFVAAFGGDTFDTPVGIRHAGDGSGRLFVVEQPGRIIVLSDDSNKPKRDIFLDLTKQVYDEGWEQGLLGLAFHPDFAANGKFYVNYTTKSTTVIEEYTRSKSNGNIADLKSGRKLLEFKQPYNNHNGGELAFGPDGYLYIGTGDGGSGGDPNGNGQNLKVLLGKILRIDVDHIEGNHPYAIPSDNPFALNDKGYREEIFAYGLRNPWRFSFDPETGQLWAADVGQKKLEEIDIIVKGGNYGWNVMEGNSCFKPAKNCDKSDLILPIWEYNPSKGSASITGGYVYRGKAIPSLQGTYIFADFIDGRVWTLTYQDSEAITTQLELNQPSITSFGTNEAGEIFACLYDGSIVRLVAKM